MTGITNLKDLNNNDRKHYKQISMEPPIKNENYEVFGTIVTKKNSKIKKLDQRNISIKFGLYNVDGFFAIIKIKIGINERFNFSPITEKYK
ncbi:uncharacterized protein OCT59_013368 [Rhizophagus irregularis]|uniref:uncharacterized protein n=1 Tax=Rhizophagus irregularis TaxID=588596 RepID=UPI0019FBBB93|nr:hypothetical protein OCT59_013368 [Rhizophagus irregularis]GET53615.1 hypothetical protein GLOIN_2v705548 [Rhizophagus irregularis DAOM 181602=DAOM 197198]